MNEGPEIKGLGVADLMALLGFLALVAAGFLAGPFLGLVVLGVGLLVMAWLLAQTEPRRGERPEADE